MAVADRFDLKAAGEEARKKKEAEKLRKIMSWVVLGIVILVVLIGGKLGWDFWMDKRRQAEEARAAEEARIEAAKARKAKEQKERAAAERLKREQQRKAAEAERERKQREREIARQKQIEERERERIEREQAKRHEREVREEQAELRKYVDELLPTIQPSVADHMHVALAFRDGVVLSCTDESWVELQSYAASRNATLFLNLIKPDSLTAESMAGGMLPSRKVFTDAIKKLDTMSFTMSIMLEQDAKLPGKPGVWALTVEKGLVPAEGLQEVKEEKRLAGWTLPFVYGDKTPHYVMDVATANRCVQEWRRQMKKIVQEQKKVDGDENWLMERKRLLMASLQTELEKEIDTPPPEPEKVEKKAETVRKKPKFSGFKGPDDRNGGRDRNNGGRLGNGGRIGGGIRQMR